MKKQILISVIIPAYNASKTIIRTLDSINCQTYTGNIEIIVINDGSSDNTYEVVSQYASSHPSLELKIISQSNKGASAARNTGMQNAKGNWIAFLDSDDIWLPDKLKKQVECIEKNPEIDFIGTEIIGHTTRILGRKKVGLTEIVLKEQFIKWYPFTPTFLFKADIPKKIGYMNESFRYGEDDEFLIRILNSYSGWFLAEPLVDCGYGKPRFGYSGLSGNLKQMQIGQRRVLKIAYKRNILSMLEYILAKLYSELKYIRRIIITNYRKFINY